MLSSELLRRKVCYATWRLLKSFSLLEPGSLSPTNVPNVSFVWFLRDAFAARFATNIVTQCAFRVIKRDGKGEKNVHTIWAGSLFATPCRTALDKQMMKFTMQSFSISFALGLGGCLFRHGHFRELLLNSTPLLSLLKARRDAIFIIIICYQVSYLPTFISYKRLSRRKIQRGFIAKWKWTLFLEQRNLHFEIFYGNVNHKTSWRRIRDCFCMCLRVEMRRNLVWMIDQIFMMFRHRSMMTPGG